jgi:hypothetical protein
LCAAAAVAKEGTHPTLERVYFYFISWSLGRPDKCFSVFLASAKGPNKKRRSRHCLWGHYFVAAPLTNYKSRVSAAAGTPKLKAHPCDDHLTPPADTRRLHQPYVCVDAFNILLPDTAALMHNCHNQRPNECRDVCTVIQYALGHLFAFCGRRRGL